MEVLNILVVLRLHDDFHTIHWIGHSCHSEARHYKSASQGVSRTSSGKAGLQSGRVPQGVGAHHGKRATVRKEDDGTGEGIASDRAGQALVEPTHLRMNRGREYMEHTPCLCTTLLMQSKMPLYSVERV